VFEFDCRWQSQPMGFRPFGASRGLCVLVWAVVAKIRASWPRRARMVRASLQCETLAPTKGQLCMCIFSSRDEMHSKGPERTSKRVTRGLEASQGRTFVV
jgi:uncharacterized protein (DUF2141 family)